MQTEFYKLLLKAGLAKDYHILLQNNYRRFRKMLHPEKNVLNTVKVF